METDRSKAGRSSSRNHPAPPEPQERLNEPCEQEATHPATAPDRPEHPTATQTTWTAREYLERITRPFKEAGWVVRVYEGGGEGDEEVRMEVTMVSWGREGC